MRARQRHATCWEGVLPMRKGCGREGVGAFEPSPQSAGTERRTPCCAPCLGPAGSGSCGQLSAREDRGDWVRKICAKLYNEAHSSRWARSP